MFRRKKGGLFSEVDFSSRIVYDFRRRTQQLFENYRAVGYKMSPEYNLKDLKDDDEETLERLILAGAVDAGNEDCLIDKILGTVKKELCNLDDQQLEHVDFYTRQGDRAVVDSRDIDRMLIFWKEKQKEMLKEHEHTKNLWEKQSRCEDKEELNDEK